MTGVVKGFEHPGEFDLLEQVARSVDGPFLEIGTYAGRSTIHLARAARERDTVVFAVDHHRGSPEMAPGRECHDPDMIGPDGRHDSLPHLRTNLADAGVEDVVIPVVCSARTLAPHWRTEIGLLFIDGGHDVGNATADFGEFSPWVRDGGFLAFHDSEDAGGPAVAVRQAQDAGWTVHDRHESLLILTR